MGDGIRPLVNVRKGVQDLNRPSHDSIHRQTGIAMLLAIGRKVDPVHELHDEEKRVAPEEGTDDFWDVRVMKRLHDPDFTNEVTLRLLKLLRISRRTDLLHSECFPTE